ALDLGYIRCPPDSFVDPEAAGHFPARELVILCTGAQGEPRSALARLALGEHPTVKLEKNDLVILSSRVIPGNDRALGNIIDHLVRRGCRVMSGSAGSTELVHTSGGVVRGPELLGKGVAGLDDSRLAQARQAALDALAELGPAQRTDHGMVEEALRRAVRSAWKKGVEKRPMVLPVVLEM